MTPSDVLRKAARLLAGPQFTLSRGCSARDDRDMPCDPWDDVARALDVHGAIERATDMRDVALRQAARAQLRKFLNVPEEWNGVDVLADWSDRLGNKKRVAAAMEGAASCS